MSVRVRLAPSPTGNLHIGTARTAVFNWLFARHHGGQFLLRIEDTDLERSREEYTQNILDGLTWLGLSWDVGPVYQSQRLDLYRHTIETLLEKGFAYRCYCTPAELEEMRAAQIEKKQAPRYDNRHRNLTPEQRAEFEAQGRRPVIRFKIEDELEIAWNDMVRGKVSWKGSDLGGDMVIARAASGNDIGQPLYNLAVVADDIDMRITHVIRGEDHIANTPKQILLYEALGAKLPEFAHTPLILNQSGQKLSKRDGVTSIWDFKEMGYTAAALVNYMTLLGWSPPDNQELFTLEEAAQKFSFERVNKAGAKFDWDKLNWLNSQYLHAMPVEQLTDLLIPYWQKAGYEFEPVGDRPWLEQLTRLIGPSLTRLDDAVQMGQMFFVADVNISEEAAEQIQQEGVKGVLEAVIAQLNSDQAFSEAEAQEIIKTVTKEQKVKKGLVMRSLRAGLTRELHGPDLIQSWLLLHQRGLDITRLQQALHPSEQPQPTAEDTAASLVNVAPEVSQMPASDHTPTAPEPPVVTVAETQQTIFPASAEDTTVVVTPPAKTTQWQGVSNQALAIVFELPNRIIGFFNEYNRLLVSLGLILGTFVFLKVTLALVDVINEIPLLAPSLKVIGFGYSAWFIVRYLLRQSTRQELANQVQSLNQQIFGKNSSKS